MDKHPAPAPLAEVLQPLFARTHAPPAPCFASIDDWWPVFRDARVDWVEPIDQALIGGVLADRVGYAFAAGYQAALRRLDADLPLDRMACFSVTEEGGGHPRAVQSTLTAAPGGFILSGKKKWATLSSAGGVGLVVAATGLDAAGRNRLKVVRLNLGARGVEVIRMPETPFCPEIPHCRLALDDVEVNRHQILDGDGYERFVKPFRTLEDVHVGAAVLAYIFAVARRYDWPRGAAQELLQLLVALRALGLADPASPAVHVALEGVFNARHHLLERCTPHWERVAAGERERWQRDVALSGIAGGVRAKRAEVAWEKLQQPPPSRP